MRFMLYLLQILLSYGADRAGVFAVEEEYEKRGYLLEDFRLFHLKTAQEKCIAAHYHEFCKVLLLVSGSGSYFLEGQRYLLRAGDVVLVGSRRVHRPEFEGGQPYERIILYISPGFLQQYGAAGCDLLQVFSDPGGPVLRLEEEQRRRIFSVAAALERELAGEQFGKGILSGGLVLRLLVELGRCQRKGIAHQPEPVQPKNPRIREILQYLDSHLAEDMSIDDLAERFYLSKYHMMRLFREETGTSIHAYLTSRRLVQARAMMDEGMQATQACFRSGFRSYSSFIRSYEKLFGQTPTGRRGGSVRETEFLE